MKRRAFIVAVTALVAGSGLYAAEDGTLRVYYGTKNQSGSQGIYTGTLDLATGTLSDPTLAAEADNPGFLNISHSGRFLYAVANSKEGNWIVSYAIDPDSGTLTELNRQETGGVNPCHVAVGPEDRYVVYANYTGGSCGLMPLAEDGTLLPRSSFFQHTGGSGVNAKRQEGPHPHSARIAPGGQLVMVPDLGPGQGTHLPRRRRRPQHDAQRSAVRHHAPRRRSPPRVVHSRRQANVCLQRDGLVGHHVRSRSIDGSGRSEADHPRRCRTTSPATTRRPRSWCIRAGGSCTARTVVTTASPRSRSMSRPAC